MRRVQGDVRIFLTGLPLAAVCLTGFTVACASPHPAGPASAGGTLAGRVSTGSAASVGPAAAEPALAGRASSGSAPGPASAEGTLAGHLYAVGGPAPGAPWPWQGTVTVTGPGVHRAISAGAGGGYSVLVPAGTYAVAGRSPLYQDGAGACQAAGPVTVASGHRTKADVLCQLR